MVVFKAVTMSSLVGSPESEEELSGEEPIQQSIVVTVMPQLQSRSLTENNGVERWSRELW